MLIVCKTYGVVVEAGCAGLLTGVVVAGFDGAGLGVVVPVPAGFVPVVVAGLAVPVAGLVVPIAVVPAGLLAEGVAPAAGFVPVVTGRVPVVTGVAAVVGFTGCACTGVVSSIIGATVGLPIGM